MPLTQSDPELHESPFGHFLQVPPPQSTSVSLPFFEPSQQDDGEHPHTLSLPPPPQVFPLGQPPQPTATLQLL